MIFFIFEIPNTLKSHIFKSSTNKNNKQFSDIQKQENNIIAILTIFFIKETTTTEKFIIKVIFAPKKKKKLSEEIWSEGLKDKQSDWIIFLIIFGRELL